MDAQEEQARYHLLETVRRYGRDRLDESAEYERVRVRHMDWYLSFAESTEPKLRGADQSVWLNRLEEEHDNLRAALESSKTQDDERGLRLARALWQFWHIRGYFSEGRRWLETMLADSRAPALIRAQALVGAGYLAHRQDDYDGATRLCTQSLALFRTVGDLSGMARSLYVLGQVAEYQGNYGSAKNRFGESLALGRQGGDKQRMAVSLNSLGEVARCQQDFFAARVSYDESLSLARAIGDMRAVTIALGNLGHVALHDGDLDKAAALFSESLRLGQRLGHKIAIAEYLAGIAGVAASNTQHERAARLLGAARTLLDLLGTSLSPPDEIEFKSTKDAVRSALSEVSFDEAWEAGRSMLLDEAIDYALAMPRS
jgi:non-specific serine/threonine protein kinase